MDLPSPEPYHIRVPDEVLERIGAKVAAYTWHEMPEDGGWAYGTNIDYLKGLCAYWLEEFDWRVQEERLNRFSHFKAPLESLDVHFIHERGSGPAPLPLIISHGWPGSVVEFLDIIEPLAHPERFGGRADDAFDVVAPSLPGFGLLGAPPAPDGTARDGRRLRYADDRCPRVRRLSRPGRRLGRCDIELARIRPRTGMPRHPYQYHDDAPLRGSEGAGGGSLGAALRKGPGDGERLPDPAGDPAADLELRDDGQPGGGCRMDRREVPLVVRSRGWRHRERTRQGHPARQHHGLSRHWHLQFRILDLLRTARGRRTGAFAGGPAGRGSDRGSAVPGRVPLLAAPLLCRTGVQHRALDRDAPGRPLRGAGAARSAGRRHPGLRPCLAPGGSGSRHAAISCRGRTTSGGEPE